MAVYLDTNLLVRRGGLASLELITSRAVCREVGLEIVVPVLVADEFESHQRRLIETAFDGLIAAHREARQQAPVGTLPELPNPGELARERRRELGAVFTIASSPEGAPEEALRREVFRRRPARGGRGARDAAIWLTVREDHLARSEPGFLVSQNSQDFAAPGDRTKLHESLEQEVAHHGEALDFFASLSDLLGRLATETECFADDNALRASPVLERAALGLAHEPILFEMLHPPEDLRASEGGRLFASGQVTTSLASTRNMRGYSVEGQRICVGVVEYHLTFELGTFEKSGLGRIQRTVPFKCRVVGLLWAREGSTDEVGAAEISRILAVEDISA